MKYELCPNSCNFDPDSENVGISAVCRACQHSRDKIYKTPVKGTEVVNHVSTQVEIIGEVDDWYYIQGSLGSFLTVKKSQVKK